MLQVRYSVIVPVYQAEDTIVRCIDSILRQKQQDFELILVDDGSVDNSGIICDGYAEKDNRIIVIHQKNAGVSAARNAGLAKAQGEYIVFVDSDDYVDDTYLEQFDCAIGNADIVICGYSIEDEDGNRVTLKNFQKRVYGNCDEFMELFCEGKLNYVCIKAMKRSLICKNGIWFSEDVELGEDTLFMIDLLPFIKQINVIDGIGYHYVKYNRETLTSKYHGFEAIRRLENLNNRLAKRLARIVEPNIADNAIVLRLGPLYKNMFLENICADNRNDLIRFWYKQRWFKKVLDNADEFFKEDDIKFRLILKTKSAALLILYLNYIKRK